MKASSRPIGVPHRARSHRLGGHHRARSCVCTRVGNRIGQGHAGWGGHHRARSCVCTSVGNRIGQGQADWGGHHRARSCVCTRVGNRIGQGQADWGGHHRARSCISRRVVVIVAQGRRPPSGYQRAGSRALGLVWPRLRALGLVSAAGSGSGLGCGRWLGLVWLRSPAWSCVAAVRVWFSESFVVLSGLVMSSWLLAGFGRDWLRFLLGLSWFRVGSGIVFAFGGVAALILVDSRLRRRARSEVAWLCRLAGAGCGCRQNAW